MTLANKLGITEDMRLAYEQERLSKLVPLTLYRNGTPECLDPGTFVTLAAIHARLFE